MNLSDIFDEVSSQMKSDFSKAQKSLSHPGLKGGVNEKTVREFLRQYLPKTLDVTTGVIVDSKGNHSLQLDIIICDSAKTPIFFESGEIRVIPIECVYAVIEVKAFLDKQELEKAYKNMLSVKSLVKKAYFNSKGVVITTHYLYSKEWDNWPIQYFVFGFDSTTLDSIVLNLRSLQGQNEVHMRIDSICILGKGVILNKGLDGMFSALPTQDSNLLASSTSKPLLLFYVLISVILNQASMKSFNMVHYIKELSF